MNSIYGLDIIVSPLIKDKAKVRFDHSFLGGGSTCIIEDFNLWLDARFCVNHEFIITRDRIYCSEACFAALKHATAEFCRFPVDGYAS